MSFTCPRCAMTSHHPMDEDYGYCGNCHDFTGTPKKAPTATSEAELQFWFDMRQASDQMALAQWRAAHPNASELYMPEHADLVIWLLDQLAGLNRIERTPAGMIDWKMEAERANRLLDAWERCDRVDASLAGQLGGSIERNAKLRECIAGFRRDVERWLAAYPLEQFPEPDFIKAGKALWEAGQTLDAISASNMRHVLQRVLTMLDDVK